MPVINVLSIKDHHGEIKLDSVLVNPEHLKRLEALMTNGEKVQASFVCTRLRITFTTKGGSKITLVNR